MKSVGVSFFIVLVALCVCIPTDVHAVRPFDFGGRVMKIVPCIGGTLVTVQEFVPAIPPTPQIRFYFYTALSALKQFGPPTHPGQRVLGKSYGVVPCLVPCPIGVCPIGAGLLVMPNAGSSLI